MKCSNVVTVVSSLKVRSIERIIEMQNISNTRLKV
jgi:hypothetical protein